MPLNHHGLFRTSRGIGTPRTRRYDAYKDAKKLGITVEFVKFSLFDKPGMNGLYLPHDDVIFINSDLDENGRHDELAHQLAHRCYHKSGRVIDEARIREETAHRLIPVKPLIAVIEAVLEEEKAGAPTPQTAVEIADRLGSHVSTVRDRLRFCSLRELAGELGALYSRIPWPKIPERQCIHDSSLHELLQMGGHS